MSTEVVVIESGEPGPADGTIIPVATVEAVSPNELSARLDLLEMRMDERISAGVAAAFEARMIAEEAQETAEVAAVVAAVAVEEAVAASEEQTESAGADNDEDEDKDSEEGVRAPERRSEQAPKAEGGGAGADTKRPRRYGAGFLSGGR